MALTIFLNNKKVQCHFSLLFLFRLDTRRSTRMVKAKTGNLPVLLVDTTDVLLIVADTIWCHIRDSREALLAYIGTFYVLDYDYPAAYEIGLTMVHFFYLDISKYHPIKYNLLIVSYRNILSTKQSEIIFLLVHVFFYKRNIFFT